MNGWVRVSAAGQDNDMIFLVSLIYFSHWVRGGGGKG